MAEKKRRKNERADGLIQVQVDYGRDPETGKRLRKYFYGKTKKEAEAKRDEFLEERDLGISERSETLTVLPWAMEWLETYKSNIDEKSQEIYRGIINVSLKPIHSLRVRDVRNSDLQRIANNLTHYSSSRIAKTKIVINGVFKRAFYNKICTDNPAVGIVYPKGSKGSHRALEAWETELILNHWHEHRAGIWFMLMLYCGLRRGEAIALGWENVNFEAMELTIDRAIKFRSNRPVFGDCKNTAAYRTLPIPAPLLKALDKEKQTASSDLVCVSAEYVALSEQAFEFGHESFMRAMNSHADKTFAFLPHDLRHTYATWLYDAGIDLKSAQYYLGHKTIQMTMQLYTHLSELKKEESKAKLHDFFS